MIIGTTDTETPFLPESELPELARLTTSKTLLNEEESGKNKGESVSVSVGHRGRDHNNKKEDSGQVKAPGSSKERVSQKGSHPHSSTKKRSKSSNNSHPTIGNN